MAFSPWHLRELVDDVYSPLRNINNYFGHVYDQNFGLGLFNDDLLHYRPSRPSISGLLVPLDSGYLRPLRHIHPDESGVSTISNKNDQLQVNLDVQQFKPEEVSVKVVDDYLVIEGQHEEKKDEHGFVSRQFTRRYKLPENIKHDAITSKISSDGILSITAPKNVEQSCGKERAIPIVPTNKPAIKRKADKKTEENDKMET